MLDATHAPALASWVASANDPETDFPIQNLPLGRFRRIGSDEPLRMGVAIGELVLDLRLAAGQCPWPDDVYPLLDPLAEGDLRAFMAAGPAAWKRLRAALSEALSEGSDQQPFLEMCLLSRAQAQMALPCPIGEYTDFYTSIHHATAVGRQYRPDNPLLPNFKWVPIGYHGRSSSIGISGQELRRPVGQTMRVGAAAPAVGPTRRLDFELELGAIIGLGNDLGEPVPMLRAESHVFGLVLLNDWSARDIQGWEYQPLGPFLSKNFGSTLSPWVVTLDALAPFRRPLVRPAGDPEPLPYLDAPANRRQGAFDIGLQAWLQTERMREQGHAGDCLTRSSSADAYWTLAQLVAHHTVNGCNLQPGDLFGTGTLSGPQAGQGACLLELTEGGKKPLLLSSGEQRCYLQDGDAVILRAACQGGGARRIGWGECRGTVLPARTPDPESQRGST